MRPEPALRIPRLQGTTGRRFHMVLPAAPLAVRRTVQDAARHCAMATGDSDFAGTAQIVLAEVLNNVVEHAQCGQSDGIVELILSLELDGADCTIRDDGHPMPEQTLPCAPAPLLSVATPALPEGGFGWPMVRSLTRALAYRHESGWNITEFVIPYGLRAQAMPVPADA